jgi:FKBP-type peptidyl-prolyl cis-trans isomerase FklB
MNAQTARDYASYAIGLDMASRFQADETPINVELLLQGLKDGFSGAKPRFSEAQLRAAAEAFDKEMQLRSQERFQLIAERNKKDGATFLAENKKKKTVKSLPSGLQYEVVKSGTGKSPKMTDKIKAHYHGTLIDGTVFDTTQEDDPVEIEVTSAIAGWTEALPLMKVGDKWRLYVPSDLAYGADGFGPVPPNAVLIFDLELLEVVPATAAPAAPATLPRPTK